MARELGNEEEGGLETEPKSLSFVTRVKVGGDWKQNKD